MKYSVIREFKDKFRQVRYYPGDEYEHDGAERVTFLQQNGYLGEEIKPLPGPKRTRKVKDDGASG
jgi:hypothetical protein